MEDLKGFSVEDDKTGSILDKLSLTGDMEPEHLEGLLKEIPKQEKLDDYEMFTFETPKEGKRRRKRSSSEEIIPNSMEKVYQRIESFLDKEGLYIISPSPLLQPRGLKSCVINQCIKLERVSSICSEASTREDESEIEQKSSPFPAFLVRRTSSIGNQSSNKTVQLGMFNKKPVSQSCPDKPRFPQLALSKLISSGDEKD